MKQTEEYYYGKMPKDKQNVYRAMLHGLMELSDEFLIPQVPTTDGNWLYDVFFQLRLDHPEIFWAVGFKYRYYKDSPNLILIPEYIFDKNKIREHQKALGARVDKLVRTAMKFSEWDKEKYVHDFICENIRYDKLKKPYSHEIIGPLGHGVGVCEGIAKSVKVLCDALGVWCIIVISEANPEKKIKLATYASRCIENEILMYLRRNSRTRMEVSIDEPLNVDWDGNELLLSDILGTDEDVIYRDLEHEVECKLLVKAINKLNAREKMIICLRFGLNQPDGKEKTQKEVADLLGISQSYISRLEKRIMVRLKKEIVRYE